MVLVDTSVWIDFFAGSESSHVGTLERLLTQGEDVCISGIILQEILQGIRKESVYKKTRHYLDALLYLPSSKETHISAANLYRMLRRKGITIRKPVDCLIASLAISHDVSLLHNDRDFDHIKKHSGLMVIQ